MLKAELCGCHLKWLIIKTVAVPADESPLCLASVPTCSNLAWEKRVMGYSRFTAPLCSSVDLFFFFTSCVFVISLRENCVHGTVKASLQAKGETLGHGKERKSFLEFASRHRNHLYPESPHCRPLQWVQWINWQGFLNAQYPMREMIRLVTHLFLLWSV